MAEVSLERRARVREANQDIVAAAERAGFRGHVPLLCECGDPGCKGFARMAVDAFNVVATQPNWWITGDAHGTRYTVVDSATGDAVLRGTR